MAIFSIGSNSRDYPDTDAFIADLPATLTEQMEGQHYNDSEFTTTTGVSVSGITTTAAFNIVLSCATGESYRDNGNALRYNVANGVGIRKTSSYGSVMTISVPHTELRGLQLSTTGANNTIGLSESTNILVDGSIISSSSNLYCVASTGAASTYINSIIHVNDGASAGTEGLRVSYTAPDLHNCTIISTFPSSTAFGIEKLGGAANSTVVKNTAIFGFGTAIESGAWGAGTDFNATDDSSLPAGSNNLTSLTTSDQFENVASAATLDLRLKTGNSLDGNGTPDSSFTNDLDIFFNTRSLTTPSIGAYETVSGGGSTLTANSGTYSYTGTNVDLLTGKLLQADSGTYSYTGTTISLLKGFLLSANTGSYSYSGTDVTLTFTPASSFVLTADTGDYTYTGSSINFNRNRVIIATSGTYTCSGTDVQIILPGQLWTDKVSESTSWGDQASAVTDWNNQINITTTWTDK